MGGHHRERGGGTTGGYGAVHGDGYASYAWRLIGLFRTQAGWLDLRGDRLRYSTPDGVVFDVPLTEVGGLTWPWYYFSGGVKLTVAGEEYRFSFVEPNGARYPEARARAAAGDPETPAFVAAKAQDVGVGRGVGRRWRSLLEGRTAS